jgi:hypothetical protein
MGAFLAFPIVLLCSLFFSITFADAASAISGTWTDSKTITVNNVKYTGPTNGYLVSGTTTTAANYQVFSPASGASRVYFNTGVNLSTAKSGSYTSTGKTNAAETLTLTNTQATAGATTTATTTAAAAETTVQETCAVDGVGWLICPIGGFLSKVTDGAYSMAEKLLFFEVTNPFSTDPAKNPIFALWSAVRNLANIAFVIAFFAVIFSQATSIGISAYGIRKMLPRIIAAAILVNLSYYLCIFAIDISNILGSGLSSLIGSLPAAADPKIKEGETWESLMSNVLVGSVALGIGIAMIAWATGTVFAFMAFSLLAIVTAVAIFMARHVLLIMLIILSPLAFVAYILPNTENIFDKWKKAFIAMLVMYPLVAILFAGSKVASRVMTQTADQVGGDAAWIYKLFSLAVLAIPLFGIPWIVKFSGGFIGRVAGMVNDRSRGLVDRARNKGEEGAKVRRAETGYKIGSRVRKMGDPLADRTSGWGYNEDGTKKKGISAFAARRAGRAASAPSRYGYGEDERNARMGQVKHEMDDERWERLNTGREIHKGDYTDKNGVVDERAYQQAKDRAAVSATRLAEGAAGVSGIKGAQRLQRVAREQRKKEMLDDVNRHTSDLMSIGALDPGAYYYEFDDDGNVTAEYADHGRGMIAMAGGAKVGVVKAGQERTVKNALENIVDTRNWRNDKTQYGITQAAMKRTHDIGDGAAVGYGLYGDDKQGIKALSDDQMQDYLSWTNAGQIASKISHLVTNDNGLNGVSGDALSKWHGNEFIAAGSRVRQLREQGEFGKAQKIQDAVENAYATLSTDPNLAKDFKQKHVDAMRRFNSIVVGDEDRVALREYGDRTDSTSGMVTPGLKEGNRIANPSGAAVDQNGTRATVRFATIPDLGSTAASSGGASVGPNEEVTQGGLIVPHGTRAQAAASAASATAPSAPTPAAPTAPTAPASNPPQPQSSTPQPSNDPRQAGGNFGGFRYEPPQQTPPPPTPSGGSFDTGGGYIPNQPGGTPMDEDQARRYRERNGEG